MSEALRIEEVHKSFGKLEVLRGIDLALAEHEVVCLIGASGSGKSTLLRCINLLEPIEYLVVDVPEKNMGGVMELVGNRKGELVRMDNRDGQVDTGSWDPDTWVLSVLFVGIVYALASTARLSTRGLVSGMRSMCVRLLRP